MARNEQWVMLEKLFDAKLGPLGEDIREIKQNYRALQEAARLAYEHADKSHQRHDKNENRLYGLLVGTGLTGTGIGAALMKLFN